ncbi:hypothetical protein SRB5_33490 [Streptomyces sp. RB5]|uniref:Regulator of SigK n=1 Tax=Streptomyces smaragdinus TaxID=2585196 RepID=A0A7K0CIE6_9ACTN|nr:anti-sigma factor [Streptomyces smaragdinus]MQY13206.1 hypothetical protein [Streptomyces smaragdinus]
MSPDRHTLAAPYALSALPPREERRFARHLGRCAVCAGEVRALREDAVRLARAVAVPAPEGMRERVLAAIRTVEQDRPAPVPGRRTVTVAPRRTWGVRLAAAGAAFAVAAAVLLGVLWTRAERDLDGRRAEAAAVTEVLAAPDAAALSARGGGGGLNAVVSRELGRAVVTLSGLPRPARGRTYQLWAMDEQPGTIRSAGLPEPAEPFVASLGPTVRTLAVTEEPEGGSRRPTGDPLLQLPLGGT